MFNIYNNKVAFMNKKPKKLFIIVVISLIMFISIIVVMIKFDAYDNYLTKGYISCDKGCLVKTLLPTNIDFKKIKINNKNINYTLVSKKLQIDEENYVSYNNLTLKIDKKFTHEEIVDINFYYNKQRIIEKLKNKMF